MSGGAVSCRGRLEVLVNTARNIGVALIAGALAFVSYSADGGENKRAFEIADYYRTAFVGSPVANPDGSRVAFPVTRYELEKGESWSEIWMMSSDGTDLRQMTRGQHHDSSPTFSPDGASLLFVSDRGEGSQLYLMPVDGGEPRQLTELPDWAFRDPCGLRTESGSRSRPMVYPECGADAACNQGIADAVAAGPLKARMSDELLYRHWTSWREGRFSHVLLVDAASGECGARSDSGPLGQPDLFGWRRRGLRLLARQRRALRGLESRQGPGEFHQL